MTRAADEEEEIRKYRDGEKMTGNDARESEGSRSPPGLDEIEQEQKKLNYLNI